VKENRMNRKRWMEVEDELVVHDASWREGWSDMLAAQGEVVSHHNGWKRSDTTLGRGSKWGFSLVFSSYLYFLLFFIGQIHLRNTTYT
jgi:hypothetical protein